jgi:hypothetical protein
VIRIPSGVFVDGSPVIELLSLRSVRRPHTRVHPAAVTVVAGSVSNRLDAKRRAVYCDRVADVQANASMWCHVEPVQEHSIRMANVLEKVALFLAIPLDKEMLSAGDERILDLYIGPPCQPTADGRALLEWVETAVRTVERDT